MTLHISTLYSGTIETTRCGLLIIFNSYICSFIFHIGTKRHQNEQMLCKAMRDREVSDMARKPNSEKVTGKGAASAASKTIRSPKASPTAKKAAGSALAQRPGKKGK